MSYDIDWGILKAISTSTTKGTEFSYRYSEDLFLPSVKSYAHLIITHIKAYKTLPTVYNLTENNPGREDEIEDLFSMLEDIQYDVNNYPIDIEKMVVRYQIRMVSIIGQRCSDAEGADVEKALLLVKKDLSRALVVKEGRSHIQKNVADYSKEFYERYKAISEGKVMPGIKTGYSFIDDATDGLRPGELVLFAGESSAGKSQLLLNISKQMWMQDNTIDTVDFSKGHSVLFFSLEMPYEDYYDRLISSISEVPQRLISSGKMNHYQMAQVDKAINFIDRYQQAGNYFNIVDTPRGVTIEEVELRYQDAILEFQPDIVAVDYLGLMNSIENSSDPDWLKLSAIAASLHEFARTYNVVMLTAAQLTDVKRQAGSKKDDPATNIGMHRIGRASQIIHHVNIAVQIETRFQEEVYPDMNVHVIKNRRGPKPSGSLLKRFDCCLLQDMAAKPKNINVDELLNSIRN